MNYQRFFLLIILVHLFSSCSTNKNLIGLWQIDKVKVGTQEMTPIGRWTRLNSDQSQESGNGWFQHTIGSWEYNAEKKEINIFNSNGIVDEFGGFEVLSNTNDEMRWSRVEEGEKVEINFKKIEKLPQAPSNKLLGVWKLTSETPNEETSYLFFRWDQIIIDRKKGEDKKYGIYKTHGHKQELQFIYYEDPLRRQDWSYRFENTNILILERKDGKENAALRFERINEIPK